MPMSDKPNTLIIMGLPITSCRVNTLSINSFIGRVRGTGHRDGGKAHRRRKGSSITSSRIYK
jgi:hypothetical protein